MPGACKILNNASIGDPMGRIKAVLDWYYKTMFFQEGCYGDSYAETIRWLSNTTYDPPYFERGMFQSCNFMHTVFAMHL